MRRIVHMQTVSQRDKFIFHKILLVPLLVIDIIRV